MKLTDTIYGEYVIEGVLEELIMSAPVQRLKGVYQGGASFLVNEKWCVTRYEHSIGVMLLIRRLGGSIEEQIAGLLHDVSHTAFSHVVDFALDRKDEDYHDSIFQQIVMASEIPRILARHGYQEHDVLWDESKWTLLEQPAPELCADRVDYTLRDMYHYDYIALDEAVKFLGNLVVIDGRMYPKHLAAAEWFVETYYKEVISFFMDPLNIYGYDSLAHTIKLALDRSVISLADLQGEDKALWHKLSSAEDPEIHKQLRKLHRNVRVREDRNDYDIHRKSKARLIDPSVPQGDKVIKASSLSPRVKSMGEEAFKKAQEGVYIKIEST
ncbi:HD domain-containing protein [Thalassobacillus sp. CUG 92003]|uniref:HD domain-containing protein n=1 Tax=Thalassobacillus sp. CUG 92003 TaxID=2736641 RepID=UPI0015E6E33E|nr:HD domain-containing protein [Thalassobacillus sp. CUG 92003]